MKQDASYNFGYSKAIEDIHELISAEMDSLRSEYDQLESKNWSFGRNRKVKSLLIKDNQLLKIATKFYKHHQNFIAEIYNVK